MANDEITPDQAEAMIEKARRGADEKAKMDARRRDGELRRGQGR